MDPENKIAWKRLSSIATHLFLVILTPKKISDFINAAYLGQIETLHYFLETYPRTQLQDPLNKALHEAIAGNQAQAVLWLLKAGADSNAKTANNETALFKVAYSPYRNNSYLITQYLLSAGTRPNDQDNLGNTPLLVLSEQANHENIPEMALLLLNAGAKLAVRNLKGKTPFRSAADRGYLALLDVFLRKITFDQVYFWQYELAYFAKQSYCLENLPSSRLLYHHILKRCLNSLHHLLPSITPFTDFEIEMYKLMRSNSANLKGTVLIAQSQEKFVLPLYATIPLRQNSLKPDPYLAICQNKKKMLWELQKKWNDALIAQKKNFVTIGIAGVNLRCKDFRFDDNYQFIVHTTKSNYSDLTVTRQTNAHFAQSDIYISASFIDKYTPGAAMSHQENILPRLMLVFSVPPENIHFTSPEDFDSVENQGQVLHSEKIKELNYSIVGQNKASIHMAQLQREWSTHNYLPLDPFTTRCSFAITRDNFFPYLSPKELSDLTLHRQYNEILIGRGLENKTSMKMLGVAIEESDMQHFNNVVFPKLSTSQKIDAKASLGELALFKNIILLRTDLQGFSRKQSHHLLKESEQLNQDLCLNTLQLWKRQQDKDKLIRERENIYLEAQKLETKLYPQNSVKRP